MIGDQLTSLEAPFYNSNCYKPNGSASPFGEAQLNNNRLRSTERAQGSRSRRNIPPSTVGPSETEQPVETPATSGVRPRDALAPEAPVFTPVPATASTDWAVPTVHESLLGKPKSGSNSRFGTNKAPRTTSQSSFPRPLLWKLTHGLLLLLSTV